MRVSVMLKDEYLEELVEWHPDIAHIQTEFSAKFLAMKVVRQCDIPYVMTSHTNYEEYFKSKKINATLARGIIKSFERIVYGNADTLIVPSEKIRELVEEYQVKCPVVVIPTGIELGNHPRMNEDKAQLLARYGVENNGKVLVSVSRISREKNIDELIAFMPALLKKDPDITLLIVGGGPHLEHLKKKVDSLGLHDNVRFTGMVPSEEVYKYYQLGNIFVSGSTFETQGLTYVEALANALPLVCREDKCLINIIEQGKNGFTYTDEAGFIEHILTILNDVDLQGSMSKLSVKKSAAFSKEVFVSSVEQLYEEIIAKKQSGEVRIPEE
jgi:1,2-diacylglycerol 3-alpha-glucosyltransferase